MRELSRTIGGYAIFIAIFAGFIFLSALFVHGGVWLGSKILPWLSIVMWTVFALDLLIILPLAAFRKTKAFSSAALLISSYFYGLTLWFWALLLAYLKWGALGVFIGLFLAGVGVVPVAMLATALEGEWAILGQLIFFAFISYGSTALSLYFAKRADEIVYETDLD